MVTPLTVDIDADIRGALSYEALNDQIMSVRRALYHDLGVPFPGINLSLNPSMHDGRYRIFVNEVPVSEGSLKKGFIFALEEPENLSAAGVSYEGGKQFLQGYETCWVKEGDKAKLDESGVRSLDLGGVLSSISPASSGAMRTSSCRSRRRASSSTTWRRRRRSS